MDKGLSKYFADFMFKNPNKSAQIGAVYVLSAFCNFDFFMSVFDGTNIYDVCKMVSCICYLCNDNIAFDYNHYLNFETANLSTIHDYVVKFCELLGKK